MIQFNHYFNPMKNSAFQQYGARKQKAPVIAPASTVAASQHSPQDSVHFGSNRSPLSNRAGGLQAIVNDSLADAAANGNTSQVSNLLSRNIDVNWANRYTAKTPLMLAAENDKTEVLKLLIRKKANMEIVDYDNRTALMLAARKGALNSVKTLLDANARIYSVDKQGMNALLLAINSNQKEVAAFLLDHKWNIEIADYLGRTPAFLAAERGHTAILQDLIVRNANLTSENYEGMTPLMIAAREGRFPAVKALVEAGVNINIPNRQGNSPLTLAAREGKLDVVELLLEHGANVHQANLDGDSGLMLAAGHGYAKTVELLLAHGASPGAVNNKLSTPLMDSARLGHLFVAQALLEYPLYVNINQADKFGNTALHYAADRGGMSLLVTDFLKVPDITIDAENDAGNTPLLMAAARGDYESTETLLNNKADIKKTNKRGAAVLHSVGTNGHARLAKLLLNHGAETNGANIDGATPLFLAAQAGHSKVMDLLIKQEDTKKCPYNRSYTQFQKYVDTAVQQVNQKLLGTMPQHAKLDRTKPFSELLPILQKNDLFKLTELLHLAQGKRLSALAFEALNEMDSIIHSQGNTEQHKEARDQAWRNLSFLAKNGVGMEEPVISLALAVLTKIAREKAAALAKVIAENKVESFENTESVTPS